MASTNIIAVPANDTDFEAKCAVLFAGVVNDPTFKRVATSGKNQSGIDLIGARDGGPRQPVAVQCKLRAKGGRLTKVEIRSDVSRALTIAPALTEIYVVTTAADDRTYDTLALTMQQEQLALGRKVKIAIWGWDELQNRIRRDPAALKAFDPDYSASTGQLVAIGEELLQTGRQTVAAVATVTGQNDALATDLSEIKALLAGGDPGGRLTIDKLLNEQVDDARNMLGSGKAETALVMLTRLESGLTDANSGAIRARVRANIGFAHLKLGDEGRAATLLLEAYALDPTDRKVRANRLLAMALSGDASGAMTAARAMLAENADDELAASFAYQAGMLGGDGDPDTFVPEPLRTRERVAISRIAWLRNAAWVGWRAVAADAHRAHPNSAVLAQFAGDALLDQAFTAPEGEDYRSLIQDGIDLLIPRWREIVGFDKAVARSLLAVAINLITAHRALRDLDGAEAVAAEALAIDPNDPEMLIATAHLDLIRDRNDVAIEKMSRVPDGGPHTVVTLMALAGKGDWQGLVTFATLARREGVDGSDRQLFDMLLLRARFEVDGVAEPAAEIEQGLALWPGDLNMLVAAADVAGVHAPALADDPYARAVAALGPNARRSGRAMLAELALRRHDYGTVIAALDGHVSTERHSGELLWLALAFTNAPTRPRTHAFFEELAPEILATNRYARLAGVAEASRGDLVRAERHLRQALAADPQDMRARLVLHSVLLRADREADAGLLVREAVDGELVGDAQDRMRFAGLLAHHGEHGRALVLGYSVASVYRDNAEVVELYPSLILLRGDLPPEAIGASAIEEGCWFDLQGLNGVADVAGLVQTGRTPDVASFAPDHPLVRAAQGKRVDDEIVLPQTIGPDRHYRVRELKHRHLWLLHDILRTHGTRFPTSASMAQMSVEDGNIQPLLDVVRQSSDQGAALLRSYADGPVPLEVLADLSHKGVLAVAEGIVQAGGHVITCVGTREEREVASRAARGGNRKGAVLDTLTVWCAHAMGVLPALAQHFGELAVAQSTIDALLGMRAGERLHLGQEYMTVAYEGDQAVRQVHAPEDTAARIAIFDLAIAAIGQHCRVLPVDGTEAHELGDIAHRAVVEHMLDLILLARAHGMFLLSDDLRLRSLAASLGVTGSGWLQVVCSLLKQESALSRDDYLRCVGVLAARRHAHLSLDGDTVIGLAMMSPEGGYFDAALRNLGGPTADIASHTAVVAAALTAVWTTDLPSWRQGRACGKLIEQLIRGREDWRTTVMLLRYAIREPRIAITGRRDLALGYLNDWIRGHFLDRAQQRSAVAEPARQPSRRARRRR